MTTAGTNTWGVILSTGNAAGVPSGDICYFLCDDVDVDHDDVRPKHLAGSGHYIVNTKKEWYKIAINQAKIADNSITTLNSYNALIMAWVYAKTEIYLWLVQSSTYYDFKIAGTMTDYCPVVLYKPKNKLSHKEKTISLTAEEI